jgi:hypothetical protein
MKIPIVTLDKPNKNNRIYPREVMKREMRKYRKTFVKEDRALIVGKQPEDSCINLKDVIGVVKKIGIKRDKVFVEAEFLPQMPNAAAIEQGIKDGKLFLRTSGIGSFRKDKDGHLVVQDDYELISTFVTDNPA